MVRLVDSCSGVCDRGKPRMWGKGLTCRDLFNGKYGLITRVSQRICICDQHVACADQRLGDAMIVNSFKGTYIYILHRTRPPQSSVKTSHHSSTMQLDQGYHFFGSSRNTSLKIFLLLYKFTSLNRSLSKCALSLAWPQGRCAAGALNSFSRNLILGIEPPSRM